MASFTVLNSIELLCFTHQSKARNTKLSISFVSNPNGTIITPKICFDLFSI